MTQTTIFDTPHNGTPTSIAAAESIQPRAGGLRARVLEYIAKTGGATIDEIAMGTGILTSTTCARVNELAKTGAIKDSGQTRLTRSNRQATVWVSN